MLYVALFAALGLQLTIPLVLAIAIDDGIVARDASLLVRAALVIVGLTLLHTRAFVSVRRFGPLSALTLARRFELVALVADFADPVRFLLRSTRTFAIGYTSGCQHVAARYVPLRCTLTHELIGAGSPCVR